MTSKIVVTLWSAGCCTLTIAEELMRHGGFLIVDRPNPYARAVAVATAAAIALAVMLGRRLGALRISAFSVAATFVLFRVLRHTSIGLELPVDFKWMLIYAPPWTYGLAALLLSVAFGLRMQLDGTGVRPSSAVHEGGKEG